MASVQLVAVDVEVAMGQPAQDSLQVKREQPRHLLVSQVVSVSDLFEGLWYPSYKESEVLAPPGLLEPLEPLASEVAQHLGRPVKEVVGFSGALLEQSELEDGNYYLVHKPRYAMVAAQSYLDPLR